MSMVNLGLKGLSQCVSVRWVQIEFTSHSDMSAVSLYENIDAALKH